MCKYTFLLPAYKGAFFDEMLKSIQQQSYKNFKVLISDDCSPEDIKGICTPYLADKRFTYRRNNQNIGGNSLVAHWNMLVEMCDTEYLIMASDDDVYNVDFLKEIDSLVMKHPDVGLFRARTCRIDADGKSFKEDIMYEEYEPQLSFLSSSFSPSRIHCIGNYVFKTATLKAEGCFMDFPLAWYSDDATIFKCSLNGVTNTSHVLFGFRSTELNISNPDSRNVAEKKVIATCAFCEWMSAFLDTIEYEDTPHHVELMDNIRERYRSRAKGMLLWYHYSLDFSSFWRLMTWMRNKGQMLGNIEMAIVAMKWLIRKTLNKCK